MVENKNQIENFQIENSQMENYKKKCLEHLLMNRSYIKQYELLACQGLRINDTVEDNFKRIIEFNNNSIIKLAHNVHYRKLFNKDDIPLEYENYSEEFNIYSKV